MPTPPLDAITVEPRSSRPWLDDAVTGGGGRLVEPAEASGVVWTHQDDPQALAVLLDAHPQIEWVQLPWAGIEPYVDIVRAHRNRIWTCGKGIYAEPVAEHALALALAGRRQIAAYARADGWTSPAGLNLLGARVVILGGGGITESFLRLLFPFRCHVTVVRRHPQPMQGADAVIGMDDLDEALTDAELVVLALALTPETTAMFDRRRLELLAPDGWIVNVARGGHIDTDALVAVLAAGRIGGAALDVTDPEPLPADHALWSEPRCLITPHTANTPAMAVPLLMERVQENVRRRVAGEPLLGPVDVEAGY
ncbi:MAG: D-isomer specific 2-hydroxyacid dehydrogenase family protein [Acidimicrobiales bacterium]